MKVILCVVVLLFGCSFAKRNQAKRSLTCSGKTTRPTQHSAVVSLNFDMFPFFVRFSEAALGQAVYGQFTVATVP